MASTHHCLASLARLSLSTPTRPTVASTIPKFLVPSVATPQVRHASGGSGGGMRKKPVKKKKTYKTFRSYDLTPMEQFTLCDAMRYLRAAEVGHPPTMVKYDLAVKVKTQKSGPVLRSAIRLPFPVKTDTRIGVICPEGSALATEAQQLGAVAVGEESLFEAVRRGDIAFNKLICHTDSQEALKKAQVNRILGPKGLMPNPKRGTITSDIKATMQELIGADEYRERSGVVRMAVGQLGFSPQMLADNIKALMSKLKDNINQLDDNLPKAIDEVVLSTTHGPGFSLNSKFAPTDDKIKPEHLATAM
ncbi:putative mitochondrial LSU ribosomal protein L1 precursor [Cercophora samala]|uniref:Mitochondrial LSU ribosomal protein L1 n=1 Tax=Cercophora samala TaxID=330535 RepID=A0AA39Z9Z7_9PEZI|nr:putative mitochondrial LSU ribosomal protein L1 precursor [Cercophora samala]